MKISTFCFVVASVWACHAYAGQTEITIYNQNLALLKKTQSTELKSGVNKIFFDEIAQEMKPESAFIYGQGIRVLEQNYDYAGISYMTLLNANIGKKVKTVRINPNSGENIFDEALLVAVDGVTPVLKFDYGIETNFPGRVLFNDVPAELNTTPGLMAKVDVADSGRKDINLAYLATGLSWNANYVVKINDEHTFSVLGRAAITNNSGSSYVDAKVSLVAGDVHTVSDLLQPRLMKMARANVMLASALNDGFSEQTAVIDAPAAMDSYYIYNIDGNMLLKNGQVKQVSFINAPRVSYEKEGVLTSSIYFSNNKPYFKDVHPLVFYRFINDEQNGLGMPLPQGKLSFYAPDDHQTLQFIGENNIANTAKGQKISLQLGQLFDVFGEGKITQVRQIEKRDYKKAPQDSCITSATTYRYDVVYKVVNSGKKDVHMVLKQPLNSEAKIIKESFAGTEAEGNIHEWHFDLEGGKDFDLSVEVESKLETKNCNR